jgi:hypothetical protein
MGIEIKSNRLGQTCLYIFGRCVGLGVGKHGLAECKALAAELTETPRKKWLVFHAFAALV